MLPNAETPIFYSLPVRELVAGLSTDDGQDILGVSSPDDGRHVIAEVYTPRPDDPELDEHNRLNTESRVYGRDESVGLAVFADTRVDGREHTD